jgi:CubicO group peptidase (beta-lactamase class C family)
MKKLSAIILSLVIAFSVTACSSGNNEESKPVESKIAETETTESVNIKENMDSVLEHKKFEGIVYLTKDNSVIYQSATGKDEKGNDLKVDSIMYIGSISKQFCSAAILMLRDQGKLSLDNTLDTYYPEYTAGKNITLKNLLSMRSGIPDMVVKTPEAALQVEDVSSDKTEEENVAAIKEWIFKQPLVSEPDTTFEYCNANYFLLSNIVEQVSGENYYDFISKNIFEPLNMTNSGFLNDVKNNSEWGLTYDTFVVGEDAIGLTKGAGDMVSNAEDMDK